MKNTTYTEAGKFILWNIVSNLDYYFFYYIEKMFSLFRALIVNDLSIMKERNLKGIYNLLCNDEKIALELLDKGQSIDNIPTYLRNNKNVLLKIIEKSSNNIDSRFYTRKLSKNKTFALEAVKQNGKALKYASPELQKDRKIVLEAVKQNGWALYYASPELKSDREIVLEAVKQNGYALIYADKSLQNDREFVLEAVKQNVCAVFCAIASLGGDNLKNLLYSILLSINVNCLTNAIHSISLWSHQENILKTYIRLYIEQIQKIKYQDLNYSITYKEYENIITYLKKFSVLLDKEIISKEDLFEWESFIKQEKSKTKFQDNLLKNKTPSDIGFGFN